MSNETDFDENPAEMAPFPDDMEGMRNEVISLRNRLIDANRKFAKLAERRALDIKSLKGMIKALEKQNAAMESLISSSEELKKKRILKAWEI